MFEEEAAEDEEECETVSVLETKEGIEEVGGTQANWRTEKQKNAKRRWRMRDMKARPR